jgi:cytochrome c peroxidase
LGPLLCLILACVGFPAQAATTPTQIPEIVNTIPAGIIAPPRPASDKPALITLGQALFQSTALSGDDTLSCGSCHAPAAGYSGATPTAIGIGGAVGSRRVPPLFNAGGLPALMWDGGAKSLDDQIHMPVERTDEMHVDWPVAITRLSDTDAVKTYLAESHAKALDRATILASLSAYVRTLVSGASPFDRYYYGGDETAISEPAKEGLRVFVRKARCSSCHLVTGLSAPFTDGGFHSVGIGWKDGTYKDEGRFGVTKLDADKGLFKTPTLRNVALRPFLMHDGSMKSLREVIEFYNRDTGKGALNYDKRLRPLALTETDIQNLIAFLQTLTAPIVSYQPDHEQTAAK